VSALDISCIVPVYNGERFLAEALDSILVQSHPPFEIIVIDDGSTDGTPGVVANYGERVRYERQENAGPASARNAGLDLARGELIAFHDADDLWHPEKLALQLARFRKRPDLDIAIGHVQNFWMPELRQEEERIGDDHPLKRPLPGYVFQAMLARTSVFESVGRLNPAIHGAEDSDWFSRALACRITLEVLPEIVVYRRFHSTNMSRDDAVRRTGLLNAVHAALLRRRSERF
jgi:glycosyltransferase involved in cell wall biosynthesis